MNGAPWDNSFAGRLLSTLDAAQMLGLEASTVDFVNSGYAMVVPQFGLFGAAGLRAVYVLAAPAGTPDAWR
jgi:putative polymerase